MIDDNSPVRQVARRFNRIVLRAALKAWRKPSRLALSRSGDVPSAEILRGLAEGSSPAAASSSPIPRSRTGRTTASVKSRPHLLGTITAKPVVAPLSDFQICRASDKMAPHIGTTRWPLNQVRACPTPSIGTRSIRITTSACSRATDGLPVIVGGADHRAARPTTRKFGWRHWKLGAQSDATLRRRDARWSGQFCSSTIDYAAFIGRNPGTPGSTCTPRSRPGMTLAWSEADQFELIAPLTGTAR